MPRFASCLAVVLLVAGTLNTAICANHGGRAGGLDRGKNFEDEAHRFKH